MKIAITGHTSGIGQALYNRLSPNCIGFSTSNGYNIFDKQDRARIIQESVDCDIFINNAPAGFAQTYLFIELFNAWKDLDSKKIINVGSRVANLTRPKLNMLYYQAEKLILKNMSQLMINAGACTVEYKTFAYVGTKKILEKYPHFTYPKDYISLDEACDLILGADLSMT
jgi:short-subunit dehydrogenase